MYYAKFKHDYHPGHIILKDGLATVMAMEKKVNQWTQVALKANYKGASHPKDVGSMDWIHPDLPGRKLGGGCDGIYWVFIDNVDIINVIENNESALQLLNKEETAW